MKRLNERKQVWKWTLMPGGNEFHMPAGAKVLTVQMQGDMPQIWALVDPENPKQVRCFVLCGTGYDLPERIGEYVGTIQMEGGALVWHVFEVKQ